MSARDPRAAAADALGVDETPHGSPEPWAWAAFGVLAAAVAGVVYLGARPGGVGPVWFWSHGRFLLVALAAVVALVGLVRSALRPPFLQRRRGRALVALVLVMGALPMPMPYPSSRERSPSAVAFELPVEGEWVVHLSGADGGPLAAYTADRRYGLHLARPEDLALDAEPDRASDLAAHGAKVHAPAAGTVAWVRDGLPDRLLAERASGDVPELGNVVVLQVVEGEYLFLAHLLAGSIRVAPGDVVERGEPLARVGFSGRFRFTPLPHVSLHLQTTPEEGWGEGIPWSFRGHVEDGVAVERGVPGQGAVVRR